MKYEIKDFSRIKFEFLQKTVFCFAVLSQKKNLPQQRKWLVEEQSDEPRVSWTMWVGGNPKFVFLWISDSPLNKKQICLPLIFGIFVINFCQHNGKNANFLFALILNPYPIPLLEFSTLILPFIPLFPSRKSILYWEGEKSNTTSLEYIIFSP